MKPVDHFQNHYKIAEQVIGANQINKAAEFRKVTLKEELFEIETTNQFYTLDGVRIFAALNKVKTRNTGIPILTLNGEPVSYLNMDRSNSSIELPFSLANSISNILTEHYLKIENEKTIMDIFREVFYQIKPFIPRPVQIILRRKIAAAVMSRRNFPDWPLDTSVDDLLTLILKLILQLQSNGSVSAISYWPHNADYCLVLTHDVEQQLGHDNAYRLIEIEEKYGLRSGWFIVPERYKVDHLLLEYLVKDGFEIGVHGLYHDGKLFDSYRRFLKRAERINQYLHNWNSVGFRSPSAIRRLDWISTHLQAKYDSSCPTSERYGAQPGGCCTIFPFMFGPIVELPITMPQDHTLLEILEYSPVKTLSVWLDTLQKIKQRHGMALLIVHPDYMLSRDRLEMYEEFLRSVCQDTNCWFALPKIAAEWWQARQESRLVSDFQSSTRIEGPASHQGRVVHYEANLDTID